MNNKVLDQSEDRKYFTIIPRLVWALSRSPYDYALWSIIKTIAGEDGECYLSTMDLAILSMMSVGKVSDCRSYLIKQGLLKGDLRKDPGYPQPVWHLQIPDLWKRSIAWATKHTSIKERLVFKIKQKSLHQVKPSPGEKGHLTDEGGILPGETKKNQKEHLKEKPIVTPISQNQSDYQKIREAWIELFPDKPKPRKGNTTLQGKVKTRMKSKHFQEHWRVAIERASKSAYLHREGWFDLGWFLKNDDHYERCLNGNYDDRSPSRASPRSRQPQQQKASDPHLGMEPLDELGCRY